MTDHIEWLRHRLEKAKSAISEIDRAKEELNKTQASHNRDAASLEHSLNIALAERQQSQRPTAATVSGQRESPIRGVKVLDMLNTYAEEHGDVVPIAAVAEEYVRLGFWPTARQARNTIYPELKRAAERYGTWTLLRPGVFKRVRSHATAGATQPPNASVQSNGAHELEPMGISDETGRINVSVVGRAN